MLVLAIAVLTGCRWGLDVPVLGGTGQEDRNVGSIVHAWSEGNSAQADGVRAVRGDYADPRLITDAHQWRRFVDGLPPSLKDPDARNDFDGVELRDAVLVVTTHGQCTSTGKLTSRGSGALAFVVTDTGVGCMWSPTALEVWRVGLDELGVTDKAEVHIVE